MQALQWAWWANVLTVKVVGFRSLLGKFGIPVILAVLWANSYFPLLNWVLALGFFAWLLWVFVATPAWLRYLTLVVVLAALIIGGGFLLYGFLYPPTAEQTCPYDADADTKFNNASKSITESFCLPGPLPPPLEGPLHSSWRHLPYINSRDFLQQLSEYACDLPSRNALVVWGPKSTGKSLGIQAMAELWRKQGRITIDVDLKDLVGGYEHFLQYFRTRALQALWGHGLTANELRTCYVCSSHLRNKTRVNLEEQQHHDLLTHFLNYVGMNGSANASANANAKWAKDLDNYLKFVFATTDTALGIDFQGLIEFLEVLTVQRPQLAPVVILRELQFLNRIKGEALISDILRTIESKKQGRSLVGVIIESSEYTWIAAMNLLRSRESFRSRLVSYMNEETTRKELVDVLRVFTSEDFDTIWEATKGHAGSIDMIFQDVRAGTPLVKAIETARSFTYDIMMAGLEEAGPNRPKCEEELDRLRKNKWLLIEKAPLQNPELRFLIEHNILFVFGRDSVVPQHEMMRWAIETYFTKFPVLEKKD